MRLAGFDDTDIDTNLAKLSFHESLLDQNQLLQASISSTEHAGRVGRGAEGPMGLAHAARSLVGARRGERVRLPCTCRCCASELDTNMLSGSTLA